MAAKANGAVRNRYPKIAPGPRLGMLRTLLLGWPRDILGLYIDAVRQYGDIVRFRTGPWSSYLVIHPVDVKRVLQDNQQNYSKEDIFNALMKPVAGEGLLTSDGELWRRRRRLVQPAFHHQQLTELATIMTQATASMLDSWRSHAESGQPLDVASEMRRLTFCIVGRALFNSDVGSYADHWGRSLDTFCKHYDYRSRHPLALPDIIPTPRNRRFQKALHTMNSIVYGMIQDRRSGMDMGDLFSILLLAREKETEKALSETEVRDEVTTFLSAGHETTAIALAWTWYLLSKHPEAERKLHRELAEVLSGRTPTAEDLSKLQYTKMLIEESLRLYPPAWAISRNAIHDDEIGGYHIPANSVVVVSPYFTHRHPAFWENPDEFDPERFTPERTASRSRYAYFPFGGGPRRCIGEEFALMEAQLIVAMVAQKYHLQPVPGHSIEPDATFFLRARYGVLMTLHPKIPEEFQSCRGPGNVNGL